MPVLGNYMAYKIPDGTTLIDPATGKLNSDAKLLYADNYDDYLFTKQFRQEYTLSISGGNDNMDYYVSGSFLEDPSYVIMSGFKRYSGPRRLQCTGHQVAEGQDEPFLFAPRHRQPRLFGRQHGQRVPVDDVAEPHRAVLRPRPGR